MQFRILLISVILLFYLKYAEAIYKYNCEQTAGYISGHQGDYCQSGCRACKYGCTEAKNGYPSYCNCQKHKKHNNLVGQRICGPFGEVDGVCHADCRGWISHCDYSIDDCIHGCNVKKNQCNCGLQSGRYCVDGCNFEHDTCNVCSPGTLTCSCGGGGLMKCNGLGWDLVDQTCGGYGCDQYSNPPSCFTCKKGDIICKNNQLYVCNDGHSWTLKSNCDYGCSSNTCNKCKPNDVKCQNNQLLKCDGQNYNAYQNCPYGCADSSSSCYSCKQSSLRCNGNNIEKCDNNNWSVVKSCQYGCDSSSTTCNNCQANSLACSGNSLMICSGGSYTKLKDCPYQCDASTNPNSCYDCTLNSLSCSSNGSSLLKCTGHSWVTVDNCNGYGCDSSTHTCFDCVNGATKCSGNTIQICTNGRWVTHDCPYGCNSATNTCNCGMVDSQKCPYDCCVNNKCCNCDQNTCQGKQSLQLCVGGILSNNLVSCGAPGCDSTKHPNQCYTCSSSVCYGNTKRVCTLGYFTNEVNCTFGCDPNTNECFQCDQNTCLDASALRICNNKYFNSSIVTCAYGCDGSASPNMCRDCNNDVCNKDLTGITTCSKGYFQSDVPCPYGLSCDPQNNVCFECKSNVCADNQTMKICNNGYFNGTVKGQYGCDTVTNTFFNCSQNTCLPNSNTLQLCQNNFISGFQNCSFGCDSTKTPNQCKTCNASICDANSPGFLKPCGADNYFLPSVFCQFGCNAQLRRCNDCVNTTCSTDGTTLLSCVSGFISNSTCQNGCNLQNLNCNSCKANTCSSDGTALQICNDGKITIQKCPFLCDSVNLQCFNCSSNVCQGSNILLCNNHYLMPNASACPFGCDSKVNDCFNCNATTCDGTKNIKFCSNGHFSASTPCPFNCDPQTNTCFDCQENTCDPTNTRLCVNGRFQTCPYGCDPQKKQCFTCNGNQCNGTNLFICSNNYLLPNPTVCPFGCDIVQERCFDCSSSVCNGKNITTCSNGYFLPSTQCPFGCDSSMRQCFDCTQDVCNGASLSKCVGGYFSPVNCTFGCDSVKNQCFNCSQNVCQGTNIVICSNNYLSPNESYCPYGCSQNQCQSCVKNSCFDANNLCLDGFNQKFCPLGCNNFFATCNNCNYTGIQCLTDTTFNKCIDGINFTMLCPQGALCNRAIDSNYCVYPCQKNSCVNGSPSQINVCVNGLTQLQNCPSGQTCSSTNSTCMNSCSTSFCSGSTIYTCDTTTKTVVSSQQCPAGQVCDKNTLTCNDPCTTPNEIRCDASSSYYMNVCSLGGTWTNVSCPDGYKCDAHSSKCLPTCNFIGSQCNPNNGSEVWRCSNTGIFYEAACTGNYVCDTDSFTCGLPCKSPGTLQCDLSNTNVVFQCSKGYTLVPNTTCNYLNVCDPTKLTCSVPCLKPNALQCNPVDYTLIQTCTPSKTWQTYSICTGGQVCDPNLISCGYPCPYDQADTYSCDYSTNLNQVGYCTPGQTWQNFSCASSTVRDCRNFVCNDPCSIMNATRCNAINSSLIDTCSSYGFWIIGSSCGVGQVCSRGTCIDAQASVTGQSAAPSMALIYGLAGAAVVALIAIVVIILFLQRRKENKPMNRTMSNLNQTQASSTQNLRDPVVAMNVFALKNANAQNGNFLTSEGTELTHIEENGEILSAPKIPCLIPNHDFEEVEDIGKGPQTITNVIKINQKETLKRYNLEPICISKVFLNSSKDAFQNELSVQNLLNHPNVIKLVGYCEKPFTIIANRYRYSLTELFKESISGSITLTPDVIYHISRSIASGMEYVHSKNVIHFDIKPSNILLDEDLNLVISDFGSSAIINTNNRNSGQLGNPKMYSMNVKFLAPEIFDKEFAARKELNLLHKAVDVYSYSMVLYELLFLVACWRSKVPLADIPRLVSSGKRPQLDENAVYEPWKQRLVNLMISAWAGEARKRPTFAQIVKLLVAAEAEFSFDIRVSK